MIQGFLMVIAADFAFKSRLFRYDISQHTSFDNADIKRRIITDMSLLQVHKNLCCNLNGMDSLFWAETRMGSLDQTHDSACL